MSDLKFIFRVSRPRFWIYVFGPYLLGLAAGAASRSDFLRLDALMFGLFFLLPANLLIYGINDIFDWETDWLNPKKAEYETLVRPELHRPLMVWIAALNIPFAFAAYLMAPHVLPSLAGFTFFSVFYSAPPIRAKAIPIIDSLFNILYVFPAAFAYQMISGSFPPLLIIAAGGLWTMAMHAFSAIPDIDADRKANVNTVATLLGKAGTHIFCIGAYIGSAALASRYIGVLAIVPAVIYSAMIGLSLISKNEIGVFSVYRRFPIVNAVVGFALFWLIALPKFF